MNIINYVLKLKIIQREFHAVTDEYHIKPCTRGLPRPLNHIHVDTQKRPLCYIPGLVVRTHTLFQRRTTADK